MLGRKLVLVAASLAVAHAAVATSHIKVSIVGHDAKHHTDLKIDLVPKANNAVCNGQGQSPMSVEGVEGVFCVTGQACVADVANGACPGPQAGLPNGSHCGKVKTGVYGCIPSNVCTGKDQSPMSVEGVEGIFCVTGQACVADIGNGACPGPQAGLPNGAYCGKVKTGVFGCKPNGSKHIRSSAKKSHSMKADALCNGEGQSPMSVEGVEGVFCVTGQACVADIGDGACPGPQEGLPYGAHCGKVKTGVYGCQPNDKPVETPAPAGGVCDGEGESPMSVEGVEGIFCVTGQACVADIDGACPGPQEGLPYGAYCGTVKTGVLGCKPNDGVEDSDDSTDESDDSTDDNDDSTDDSDDNAVIVEIDFCNGEGESPMSVEGVEGIFCVTGQACVADIADGACPGPQDGLPNGAYCGKVKTGVYGCKPNDKPAELPAPSGLCTGEGESPMSVEGVEGIFCVTGQACVADIADGACPGPQEGLPFGAHCGKVKTGVYGCKPNGEGDEDSEDSDDSDDSDDNGVVVEIDLCNGEGESPMSVEGVEGIFCVTGQACVADIADGACPGPQDGLPNGSHCGKVKTGVYGCKPNGEGDDDSDDSTDDSDDSTDDNDDSTDDSDDNNSGVCNGEGESPMSVEGVEGIFCVTGQACVADIADGACPGPQDGLPYGAYCGKVKTGVYGCKPNDKPVETPAPAPAGDCSGEGQSPMSVEGVEGIFCVTGQACVADIADGACPGPQDGLPNGAECGIVATGVYGCKPKSAKHLRHKSSKNSISIHVAKVHAANNAVCNGEGQSPMSVEGVEGVFCVTGQACVADVANGACPGPQAGLPNGSHCGKVKTGVYGCIPSNVCTGKDQSPMSVEGVEGIFCVTGQACVADIGNGACPGPQAGLPNGAYCGKVKTGVFGCKPNGSKHIRSSAKKSHSTKGNAVCNGQGQSPMSVEGVEGVFCVTGQACVADVANGACPGPQAGLPNGSHCGKVKTGVYGCIPSNGCTGKDQSPMSVEGVEGIFCVTGQACVADIGNGACPGPQAGLPNGSYCGKVKTGVFGCKPNGSKHKKEHPIKVIKVHGTKKHAKKH